MEKYKDQENYEDRDDQYENIAYLLIVNQYPNKRALTDVGQKELDVFLKTASDRDKDEVQKRAEMKYKFIIYLGEETSFKDVFQKKDIEKEMNENPQLREYIERKLAWKFAERYSLWKDAVDIAESIDVDLTKRLEMNEDEIEKLLDFIERYPKEVEESIIEATSAAKAGEKQETKDEGESDISTAYMKIEFLKNVKKYLNGEMGEREENDFIDLIIENQKIRIMIDKIKKALK